MKKLLCIILSLLLLVAFCGCDKGDTATSSQQESNSSEADTSSTQSDESQVSEAPSYLPEPSINGVKLSEYTLAYESSQAVLRFSDVAEVINEYTKATFGIELNTRAGNVAAKGNEIVIGLPKNRTACDDYRKDYGYGGYTMAIKGNAVVLAGSYANGSYFAAQEFIKLLSENENLTDAVIEGSENVIKVACVGDSITQGVNSKDKVKKIYPAYLQNMLGWNYFVLNAGISGYSMIKTDPYAYCKSAQYTETLNFVPDVIIFGLGTNDANPTPTQPYKDWNAEGREELFMESARELLDSFYAVNPDCQIFLNYSSSLFKVGDDKWDADGWNANIVAYVRPLLEQLVAEYGLSTVEFWEWSIEHSELYTDGLHPCDETYLPYAEHIYETIKDTIKKP